MRIVLLYILVTGFSVYAYVNWFRSLCFMILLMGIIEHPDMPKAILGIQGLNPWNILLVNVLIAWLIHRRRERLRWDMPRPVNVLLALYLLLVVVGFVRAVTDMHGLANFTAGSLTSEYLVNTIKWVIPGLLLFDGCRDRPRLKLAVFSILMVYLMLALQVIRWMPYTFALSGADLEARSRKIIQKEVGYSRVNMSMILCGGSWATFSILALARRRRQWLLVLAGFLIVAYGQALTGGRMGYVTWGIVGLILCLCRWRRYLLVMPVAVCLIVAVFPGVVERMRSGFGETTIRGDTVINDYNVTAGRTMIWPFVIEKIKESPLVGYGRLGMNRTGLAVFLRTQLREAFDHPHNAYLELLLDNGILGFLIVIPFYLLMTAYAVGLLLDPRNPWYAAVGGMALSLLLALLVAGLGSQTFYPREGAVGMWAAVGLMMRFIVERQRATVKKACVPSPSAVRPVPRRVAAATVA